MQPKKMQLRQACSRGPYVWHTWHTQVRAWKIIPQWVLCIQRLAGELRIMRYLNIKWHLFKLINIIRQKMRTRSTKMILSTLQEAWLSHICRQAITMPFCGGTTIGPPSVNPYNIGSSNWQRIQHFHSSTFANKPTTYKPTTYIYGCACMAYLNMTPIDKYVPFSV